MTTNTLQPGRELDALIATTFFGWEWKQYQAPNWTEPYLLTLLVPPAAPGRIRIMNRYDRIWRESDASAKRFDGWDESYWWHDGEMHKGFPHYSTDIAAAWQVVEHFERLTYTTALHSIIDGWVCSFRGVRYADAAQAPTAPHAICLAALKAIGAV